VMLQIVVEVAGTASTSNFLVGEISLDAAAAAAVRLSVCLVSRSAMIAPSPRTSKSSARSDVATYDRGKPARREVTGQNTLRTIRPRKHRRPLAAVRDIHRVN